MVPPTGSSFGYNMAMKVLFVAGFGPITQDTKKSAQLYQDTLGLSVKEEAGHYLYTGDLPGVKHFAIWPLEQAAQSCFGEDVWPDNVPVSSSWIEFDVQDINEATRELKERGYHLLVEAREEPWKQIVTRFLSPEGVLTGVTYTPWMRASD